MRSRTGRGPRPWIVALVVASLVGGFVVAAPRRPNATPELGIRERDVDWRAFVGAKVIAAPGRTIENATLVVRDGRVVEVETGGVVPVGAEVIDVSGLVILPGFIDPYTEYGLGHLGPIHEESDPSSGPRYEGDRAGGRPWNEAIHADVDWYEHFEPSAEAAETFLARGVTVVGSVKRDGVFRGRGFVALLGEGLPGELLLESRTPQFLSFHKGSSSQSYPSSLMGSIALIRQTLLDADWYGKAVAAARRDPTLRPEIDRALEALGESADGAVFEASDELSVLRAARIAEEFGLAWTFVGSNREYARIEEIRRLARTMILPLDLPAPPPLHSVEDELDVTLGDLKHWDRAPANPAILAGAGVRFAFTGGKLKEREQKAFDNLRRMIDHGLSREVALAALTTVPAEICGVADRVGTLEPGKLANFVLADGDPLTTSAELVSVWVAGRPAKEYRRTDVADPRGRYAFELEGSRYELEIRGKHDALRGGIERDEKKAELRDVRKEGDRVFFSSSMHALGIESVLRFELLVRSTGLGLRVFTADDEMLELRPERLEQEASEEEKPDGSGEPISTVTFPNIAYGFERLPEREDVLLRGGTIWTVAENGILEDTDLLVRDGRIAEIGKELEAPRGVRVIELAGRHVTPGMIDEHSHIAISGGVNEGSHAVTSEVRIGDVVNPDDIAIYRALAGGTTTAQLLHGSANPIGGQAQVIKLRWGQSPEGMKLDGAPPTIKFALGENVKQSNWGSQFTTRYPQSRMGGETIMRDAFLAARDYDAGRQGRSHKSGRRDLRLEALLEILESERFVHCHSYTQAEILMLMRLAEELGFRIKTFTHILEGYKVATEMAAHGAGASSFSDWWAYKFEVYDAIPYNTCLMAERGVVVSINSDSGEVIRRLNQEAGKAVMYCSMPPGDAIRLATLNPAIQLGIEDRVGSLEPGKDADFVIWNGYPLSVVARVDETWIEGVPMFTRERDARLRSRDDELRRRLVQKALQAKPADKKNGEKNDRRRPESWDCEDVEDVWRDG